MKTNENKSDNWYDQPDIQADLSRSLDLFDRYKRMMMCDNCLKLDVQFEALFSLLMVFNKSTGNENDPECICDLMLSAIPDDRKNMVYQTITGTRYERIKEAFQIIIQICENEWEESENLFGILKKHRFKPLPELTISQQFQQITRYFHLTFIYLNLLKNKCENGLSESLRERKTEAAYTLMPLIDSIFHSILDNKVLEENIKETANTTN